MSRLGKSVSESGVDELSDRLKDSLNCDDNKPDFKELDLGSPVSPLRTTRQSGGPTTTTTTATSSSSSSSSGSFPGRAISNPVAKGHSGELSSGSTETSPTIRLKPGHARSDSCGSLVAQPYNFSGSGSGGVASGCSSGGAVNSPPANVLPTGNICPSGRIVKTGMSARHSSRSDVLGFGMGNYGHGSIMRGSGAAGSGVGSAVKSGSGSGTDYGMGTLRGNVGGGDMMKRAMMSMDPEEVKRVGNELYKKGHFSEALCLYDRAITLAPRNAAYRSNRAAALTGLGRVAEAVRACEEAVRLDPGYGRAHQRLGSLLIRLGQVEDARKHLCFGGQPPDPAELMKLKLVEKHLGRCADSRKVGDWICTLREGDAAIDAGADHSPQLFACKAECLLKLQQLEDAECILSNIPKLNPSPICYQQSKFFGMLSEAYIFYIQVQIEMALGRFDNAVASAERAGQIDPLNTEVASLLNKVNLVARARSRGNDLFKSERITEACAAYGEGLKYDPCNSVLYCNRAACWFKLGKWERSIEDCNHALRIQPNYKKALLRRAISNSKLERWDETVRDYEVLRRELPDDNNVAESLFHAQVALKKSRGEVVYNMKFGGEVEEITGLGQFRAAISSPGVSVVHFKMTSNPQCTRISSVLDALCSRYPSINFLKVDVEECAEVANAENVSVAPTFKIFKDGSRMKEIINPTSDVLEASVRHYSF